jgi:hypothetical protein
MSGVAVGFGRLLGLDRVGLVRGGGLLAFAVGRVVESASHRLLPCLGVQAVLLVADDRHGTPAAGLVLAERACDVQTGPCRAVQLREARLLTGRQAGVLVEHDGGRTVLREVDRLGGQVGQLGLRHFWFSLSRVMRIVLLDLPLVW